jgi:hypothetical protein
MSGSAALLLIGAGVGGYALYRYLKAHEDEHGAAHKIAHGAAHGGGHAAARGYYAGAARGVDYLNPADARSDNSPTAMYFTKPYQILNIGEGARPMEVDASGQPTNRKLVLPGEAASPGAIRVGADAYGLGFTGIDPNYVFSGYDENYVFSGAAAGVDYLDPADARRDPRPDRMYYVMPYQILNIGPGARPMEIDATGQPTNRKLVLPGESMMAGAIRVGAGYDEFTGADGYDPYDYFGFTGRGGGGGGRGHHQPQQQQQQQQQQEQQMDPSQQDSGEQQPPQPPMPPHHRQQPHYGGRR